MTSSTDMTLILQGRIMNDVGMVCVTGAPATSAPGNMVSARGAEGEIG